MCNFAKGHFRAGSTIMIMWYCLKYKPYETGHFYVRFCQDWFGVWSFGAAGAHLRSTAQWRTHPLHICLPSIYRLYIWEPEVPNQSSFAPDQLKVIGLRDPEFVCAYPSVHNLVWTCQKAPLGEFAERAAQSMLVLLLLLLLGADFALGVGTMSKPSGSSSSSSSSSSKTIIPSISSTSFNNTASPMNTFLAVLHVSCLVHNLKW